ncbi:MAG TPA: FkbM family methyltransferase [Candidatus Binatus sp.]|nr:FkbM family methyltransferase [Candidatus Binatus sp.]
MLISEAVVHPRAAWFALRARSVTNIARIAFGEPPERVADMARFARFRSSPASVSALHECFPDIRFEASDDPALFVASVPSGERLFIRKSCAWQDAHVVNDSFVREIYRVHPSLRGGTVLDIGANIGDTAVYFGRRGARVVAFEPDPELSAIARSNAALNGVVADIRSAAIGDACMTLPLTRAPDGADPMSAVLFVGNTSSNKLHSETTDVPVVPFADVLTELGALRLVKFDCQGCEYYALASVTDDALAGVEHLLLEYHASADPLIAKLRRCGFAVRLEGRNYLYADR